MKHAFQRTVTVIARLCLTLPVILHSPVINSQVRIRVFSDQRPESALFRVTRGSYEVNTHVGEKLRLDTDNILLISRVHAKLALKAVNTGIIICDSVCIKGLGDDDIFSLRLNTRDPVRREFTGSLECHNDLETLLFIIACDIESYIAGVVKSEGGSGKHVEFYKTQAVIARTYMYKYFYKHSSDRYNLCDNTHCQVFNGLTVDSVITRAARETRGLVIIGPDSSLVISAFHSNCGGETSPAEYVWLSPRPYLKRVVDQYCISSRNAAWQKTIPLQEWKEYLVKKGLHCNPDEIIVRNSECLSRVLYYHHDSLEIPMSQVRNDLGLRSAFFSLTVVGNQVVIKGRGYGHGVGLCQEGAMVMAARGHDFRQIIGFYYPNTRVTGIDNVTDLPEAFLNGEK